MFMYGNIIFQIKFELIPIRIKNFWWELHNCHTLTDNIHILAL